MLTTQFTETNPKYNLSIPDTPSMNGVKVSSLYIAQIKRKYGIDMGANYNMAADPEKHEPTCPAAKEQIIIDALKHYRMLDPSVEMIPNSEVVTNESKKKINAIFI